MPQFFHGRGFRVLVHDADLSCYFSEATASYEVETAETTTFCTTARTYIPGVTDGTISLSGLWDGSPRAIDELMRNRIAIEPETVVSLFPSNYLTTGRRVDLFSAHQTSLEISGAVGSVVSLSADFQGSGPSRPGYILAPHVERTADVTEDVVDTGANFDTPSGNGLVSQIHVTDNARTAPTTVTVQASGDELTWVTLATFTVPAYAVGPPEVGRHAERIRSTGAVPRYLRAAATSPDAPGAITYAVSATRW